jgi:hypothetical protein
MAKGKNICTANQGGGALYGLGFVGALIYYLQTAHGVGEVILGILKAILWPAFLTHRLLGFLGM